MKLLLDIRGCGGHARKGIEPRAINADNRVLADESPIRFQICENNSHTDYLNVTSP